MINRWVFNIKFTTTIKVNYLINVLVALVVNSLTSKGNVNVLKDRQLV